MKKRISILLAVIMVLSLLPTMVFAEDKAVEECLDENTPEEKILTESSADSVLPAVNDSTDSDPESDATKPEDAQWVKNWGGDYVWWKLNDGILIIGGTGAMPDYGYTDQPWFDIKKSITAVVIESGVTYIGAASFYQCTAITSVTIPASMTGIGSFAFYDCSALADVIFTEDSLLESIGEAAFYHCGLTDIMLPVSVTLIGDGAFCWCPALADVTVSWTGENVVAPGTDAFKDIATGASLHIPDDTEELYIAKGWTAWFTLEEGMKFHEHKGILAEGKPATNKEAGYKSCYRCDCGRFFEDEACKIEITDFTKWKAEGGNGYIPKIEKGSTSPRTGDTNNMDLWILLFAFSAVGLGTCFVIGKKRGLPQ